MRRQVIKVRPDNREITPLTYFLSIVLGTIAGSCFSMMLTATYDLYVFGIDLIISALVYSVLLTIIMTRKNRLFTIGAMILVPLAIGFFFFKNSFHLRDAFNSFIATTENVTQRDFGIEVRVTNPGRHAVPYLLMFYNLLIITLTTFVVVHRKPAILVLMAVAPYLILTIAITYREPGAITSFFSAYIIIVMIIFDRIRKTKRQKGELLLLIVSLPILVLAITIGIIFPKSHYKNDKYAIRGLRQTRKLIAKTMANDTARKKIQDFLVVIEQGRVLDSSKSINNSSALLGGSGKVEDLNLVGDLSLEEYQIGTVTITRNTDIDDNQTCNFVYLRNKSLDYYLKNTWTSDTLKYMTMDEDEINANEISESGTIEYSYFLVASYGDNSIMLSPYEPEEDFDESTATLIEGYEDEKITDLESGMVIKMPANLLSYEWDSTLNQLDYSYDDEDLADSQYYARVEDVFLSACTPYYTDGYYCPSYNSTFSINAITDPSEYIGYSSMDNIHNFAFARIPTKKTDLYPQEYISDYVNTVCLRVPTSTKVKLIDSGVLPDWYMSLYRGETEMEDYEKVRAVCDYLRSLHPYDEYTPYPPEDEDFVYWFITESDTGFCVHYATAAVILLRMIDVPCRYVSGYLLDEVTLGHPKKIMSTDAHAWIEFYTPEFGWVMDDPTPGNQTAASMYNIDAIAQAYPEYGSELESHNNPSYKVTPDIPDITKTPDVTVAPEDNGSTIVEGVEKHRLALIIILSIIFVVTALLLIARISYVYFWKKKFTDEDINNRARAYYNYYRMILRQLDTKPSKNMLTIAQVAAFSNRDITDDEMKELLESGKTQSETLLKHCKFLKKVKIGMLQVDV